MKLNACVFCGFCERYACEHYAKSVPQTIILPVLLKNPNFELRTGCQVLRINLDSTKKKATGVTYVDAAGREFEQPAVAGDHLRLRAQQRAHAAAVRASASRTIRRPAKAWSAATTRTRP